MTCLPSTKLYEQMHHQGFEVEFAKNFLHEVSVPSVVLLNKDPAQMKFVSQIFANPQVSKVKNFNTTCFSLIFCTFTMHVYLWEHIFHCI